MATRHEWQQTADQIRRLWGKNQSHAWDHAETVALHNERVHRVPYPALQAAIESFVVEGSAWAPTIPQILARATAGTVSHTRPAPETCRHSGAIARIGDTLICAVCLQELDAETAATVLGLAVTT